MESKSPQEAEHKGLIAWFLHNHVAANIFMLLLVFGGLVTLGSMRTETFPSIDPKLITVSVAYPGASPYEVADAITSRVEEELIGIEGVERISSTASEGMGVVNVELLDFIDADDVYNDVETAVNSLIDFPPEDAERPVITKVRVTPNVMTLALHGNVDEKGLKYWTETIEEELRLLPGVALTEVRGIRDYQISVEIPESSLRQYGLTLAEIAQKVRAFSEDIPAGTIEASRGDIVLRVQERKYTGEEFERIVVRTLPDGSALRIGDIGRVVDGFEDVNVISKFNNEPASFIDVKRSESGDTLGVAETVKDYLETVELPTGLGLSLQEDETVGLKDRINLMIRNALVGFMLVFLILLLFLDLKLAFWTSAAIPISFFGGIMIIGAMGYSINMVSLFAMIVVLGVVVDDGIITGESIFSAQKKNKGDPNATLKGVRAVLSPVTVGVLTTIAAFAPLIFSTGTLGQIIGVIPVVVIAILFVSLLEAYFILPAHLSGQGEWSKGHLAKVRDRFTEKLEWFKENKVAPFAYFCLRWRYVTLAVFLSIAIITMGMVQNGIIRFVFFPVVESDKITISVNMPVGTPFALTKQTMLSVEEHINAVRDEIDSQAEGMSAFESVSISIGEAPGQMSPGGVTLGGAANNLGQARVKLVPSDFRQFSAADIESMIRKRIQDLPSIDTLEFQSSLVGEAPDIQVELNHPEEDQLYKAADELKTIIEEMPGTKEVMDSFDPGKTEYVFKLNDQGLAVGLTPAQLGQQLRAAYFGQEAMRFQRGRSELIVYVRYPKEARERVDMLNETRIRLENGDEVPLASVADIIEQQGYSQILTVNGRPIVSITADADLDVTTPTVIIERLRADVLPDLQARYQGLGYSFEGESKEQASDLASLGRNMMIALMLIYVLLGAQLRSYVQPFVIMMAIPFGVVGAILGHFLLGHDLTFISLFGIVALMGVVVNDSVVLIDYMNSHRRAGAPIGDSAIIAIKRRFRPILLTTLSTCLGLLPILLETSLQAKFLIPMVISLSMGILFATVVILLLVPCLVMIVRDMERIIQRYL